MATDLERLIVSLEARTKAFENALIKADKVSQQRLKSIERQFAQTNKKLEKGLTFAGIGGSLKGGVGAIIGSAAVNTVKNYADAWTEAGNKIAAASAVSGRSARSLDDINKIATDTRSGITETVDLYAKLLRSTKDVAKSEQEVATATEIVNKAFKAGGASASEQAAGVLQLSQALSSGVLQGDELRSLRENAPLIAQAIANEFETTIGGLKQLGADGKLTVDRVFKAILDAKPLIDRAYGSTNATIAEGISLVNNSLTAFVGKLSEVSGVGGEVGRFLGTDLVNAIDSLSKSLESLQGGGGAGYLGKIAEALNTINEYAQKLGGGIGDATGLSGLGSGLFGSLGSGDILKELDEAKEKIDKLFDRLERAAKAGIVSDVQIKQFRKLRQQLRDGTIDADGASKAIAAIAGNNPGLSDLVGKFDAIIARVRELTAESNKAAAATAKIAGDAVTAGLNTDDRAESRAFQKNGKDYGDFISGRNADAQRTDLQKEIDDRADKIIKAAGEVGVAITEAAAKIQAAKEIAAEDLVKSTSASVSGAVEVIKQFEGFISKPKWDVNAFRAGYGSDTVTLADGSIQKITQGMSVSVADANRDLVRRIGEFQDTIKRQIGSDTFSSFDEKQQAALTSIAYNYGSLPQRIVDAIKTGNQATIVQAIRGLGGDNGGINRNRRNTEADMFLGGAPSGVQDAVKSEDRFNERLSDMQLRIDLLNKEAAALGLVNPLINDYGYAQTKAEIKQKLLNDAMDNGIEITPAYAAKIDELAEKYARADASREQMQEGVQNLNQQMQESSSFGKDLLGGFIQDLKDGKSASEALSNALSKVADRLLDIALNSLFDGGGLGSTPGGGILGGLFSFLFPFANGGIAKNGKPQPLKKFARGGVSKTAAIFGETGRAEAAVPLPDGRRIPVDLRASQAIPQKNADSSNVHVTVGVSADNNGNLMPFVESVSKSTVRQAAPAIIQASTKNVQKNFPGMMASAQSRTG